MLDALDVLVTACLCVIGAGTIGYWAALQTEALFDRPRITPPPAADDNEVAP